MNDNLLLRGGIAVPASPFPLLPLRSRVLFPGAVLTLMVGRSRSVALLEAVRPGDVIVEVSRDAIKSPADFVQKVEAARKANRKTVLLLVQNETGLRFVADVRKAIAIASYF